MMKTFGLGGKKIVVTGANGFLGKFICAAIKNEAARVVGIDIASAINVRNLDIADGEQFGNIANFILSDGYIDGLVNNAAVSFKGARLTSKQFMKTLEINIEGTRNCIEKFENILAPNASIVNISSVYGMLSPDFTIYDGDKDLYNSSAYGASKAAIIQMTKYYAVQFARKGIRVNSISPGGILQNQSKTFIERYSSRVPMGRMANPEEIANVVLFLLSPMSSYITGVNLPVTGGMEIW